MEAKRPVLWRWTADGMIQDAQGNWISTVDHPEASAARQLLEACKAGLHEWSLHEKADENAARLCDLLRAAILKAEGGGK